MTITGTSARAAVFAVICVLAWSGRILAQTPAMPAPVRLTFDEAIRRALEKNPTVSIAATSIARAEALMQQARAATLPFVTASLVNTTLDGSRGFDGGVTQPQDQVVFGAEVSMPLLAASRWAAKTQARDQVEVAQLTVEDVRRDVAVATAQAFLGVIAARRQVDVEQRSLESLRTHLDYAQKRLTGGVGSRLNELRAAQAVSSEEVRLENTRLGLRRAQEALGVLVAENSPVDAEGEPSFDVPTLADDEVWLTARTDVKTQQARARAADRVLGDSSRDWWPTASVSFVPSVVSPSGLFAPPRTWRLTFSVSQTLYEGGLRKAVLRQRQLTVDQARLTLTDTELRARSELRQARASLESSERALASARRAAEQAAEVVRITTVAFEVGATTNLEVIDAQRSARDAETAATQVEDAVRRARLELLVAIGRFPR